MRGSLTICILLSGIALSCGGQTRLWPEGADGAPRAEAGPNVVQGGLSSDATEGSFDGDDDAASCYISVSNYDQSCTVSSDCVVRIVEPDASTGGFIVQSGNYCKPMCICGGEAINNGAVAQYVA